uniref:Secreted protein n=1 Tax=Ascaris lumbricoides TaxID=6252 RepID=A0A0M3IVR0_ASCLU
MWISYFKVLLLFCWSIRFSVEQEKCSDTGIWGEWGAWGSCPSGSTNALNFRWRKRFRHFHYLLISLKLFSSSFIVYF